MTLSILARELKRCIALFCAKALSSIDKMLLLGIIENTDKIGFKYCLNTFQMLWNHIWSTVVIPLKYGQYMSWLARNIDQFKRNHIFYFSSFTFVESRVFASQKQVLIEADNCVCCGSMFFKHFWVFVAAAHFSLVLDGDDSDFEVTKGLCSKNIWRIKNRVIQRKLSCLFTGKYFFGLQNGLTYHAKLEHPQWCMENSVSSHFKGSAVVSNQRLIFRDSRLYFAAMLLDQRG